MIPRILRAKFEVKETELDKLDAMAEELKNEFKGMMAQEVQAIAK